MNFQSREIDAVEEDRLAADENAHAEQDAAAEDEVFDAPSHRTRGGAEGALEIHQNDCGCDENNGVESDAGPAEFEEPAFGGFIDAESAKEIFADQDGKEEGRGKRDD